MKLTKKYRIFWREDLIVSSDYLFNHGSVTYFDENNMIGYYESDSEEDLLSFIENNDLKFEDNAGN